MQDINVGDRVEIIDQWPKGAKGTVKHFAQPTEHLAWVQYDRPHTASHVTYKGSWYSREHLKKLEEA